MIERLQRTVAFHQGQEAFHAEQEAHHAQQEKLYGEERTRHATELETASQQLAELRSMAERLGEVIVTQSRAVPPETDEQILGRHPTVGKAVDRVLAAWPAEAPFTATALAEHVSRRYGEILRRPVEARVVASALRRRRNDGILEEIREGRPFQEALYRKRG
jgi:hypothetical protein